MSQSRQLAAIMFTDIVGYTALMGQDEQRAFELLQKNRELQKPIIEAYHGRWIKELGDGVMASFNTVTDAVYAAIKIQEGCQEAGFQLRIGIHQGEVVFEDNDIFGDAVNIAARIQAFAAPGAIYVSESVQNNIVNKTGIETRFIKLEALKNVKDPIKIYEVVTRYTTELTSITPEPEIKKSPDKSIAVLAFLNISNDPEQEYISDGIAEEIINSLVHLKDLKVAGRTSSFYFKKKKTSLKEIGEKLNVSTVLEGSIRKQGDRLRITAQLINVEDGFHLWSEKFDRTMDDIFAIQDEIALAITDQLKIKLFKNDRETITKAYTQNAEAYELYLKGRFQINRRGSSVLTGLEYFKQAIALDPRFALAYTGYSDACSYSMGYSFLPGSKIQQQAKQAAEKAIKLDPYLSEAYCSLAIYYEGFEWNWDAGKWNFIRAIELNPKNAQARSLYGMLYLAWIEGKFEEAEKQGQMAIKLEPLSAIDHADLAWILHTAGHFEKALSYAAMGIDLDANSFLAHRIAGLCYLGLQRYQEAIDAFKFILLISNRHQHAVNSLIWAYCSNGNMDAGTELMNELEYKAGKEYIAGAYLGLSAAYLGDLDKALKYMEKALEDGDSMILTFKYSPYVPQVLRDDPRFQKLMDRIGFPA